MRFQLDPLAPNGVSIAPEQSKQGARGAVLAGKDGKVQSIVAGTNVTVDSTDPNNPVVSSSGGGSVSITSPNSTLTVGGTSSSPTLDVTSPLPVLYGGTGSATQNFVDLSSTQSAIGGAKTFTGTATFNNLTFSANNTYNIGDTSHYASNLYATTLNLNSTASLSGGVAGQTTLTNTMTGSSGKQYGVSLLPTANVSGTAGYTGLFMNLTETSFGSGGTLLIDIQKGSSSKFNVNTGGNAVFAGSMKATQFIMGSDVAVTPVSAGQSAVTTYWALQLKGNYQNSVLASPSNIGNKDDASVIIPNQQAAKVGLIIYGQTSQTGNLQEWRANNGTSALTAIDPSGNLVFNANNIVTDTTTGTKIGTAGGASGQKLGFYGTMPTTQPLLATGASHTVDDVITALQTLGLVRQS
jgi:hypothetical protein